MKFTKDFHIASAVDVVNFFHYLVYEKHIIFHPDDPIEAFDDKEFCDGGVTEEMALMYNRLVDEAFVFCQDNNIDIYHIGYDVLYGYMKGERKKNMK